MPKDAHGREIKIGDRARHVNPDGFHEFSGVSKIIETTERYVVVEKTGSRQIPVYLSALVEVVE